VTSSAKHARPQPPLLKSASRVPPVAAMTSAKPLHIDAS
jgi:hypothetical protein